MTRSGLPALLERDIVPPIIAEGDASGGLLPCTTLREASYETQWRQDRIAGSPFAATSSAKRKPRNRVRDMDVVEERALIGKAGSARPGAFGVGGSQRRQRIAGMVSLG